MSRLAYGAHKGHIALDCRRKMRDVRFCQDFGLLGALAESGRGLALVHCTETPGRGPERRHHDGEQQDQVND